MPTIDRAEQFVENFLKRYDAEKAARSLPVLDKSGAPTGETYDPIYQTPEGQPNKQRLTAHLLYLKQQGIPIAKGYAVPDFDPVDMYKSQGAGETIANTLKSAFNQSLPGAAIAGFTGHDVFDMSHWDPSAGESIAAALLPFLVPYSGAGKVLGFGAKAASLLPAEGEIAQAILKGAGGLAAYEGAQAGLRTHELAPAIEGAAQGFITGGAAGAAGAAGGAIPGIAGKVAAPVAEIAAFGTTSPALEGRKPIWDDYLNAAGVVLGMKAVKWGGDWAAKKAASARLKSVAGEAGRIRDRVENDGVSLEQAIQDEVNSINLVEPGQRMFRVSNKNRAALQELSDSFGSGPRILESGGFAQDKDVSGGVKEVETNFIPGKFNATEPYWQGQGFDYQQLKNAADKALAGTPLTENQWSMLRRAYKLRGKYGYQEGQHNEQKMISELGLDVGDEIRVDGNWHRVIAKAEDGTVTLKNGEIVDLNPIEEIGVDVRPNSRTPIIDKNVPESQTNVREPAKSFEEIVAEADAARAAKKAEQPITMTEEAPTEGNAPAHGIQKSLRLEPGSKPVQSGSPQAPELEPPTETPEQVAKRLGVVAQGVQEGPNGKSAYNFYDPVTESNFGTFDLSLAGNKLLAMREKFAAAKTEKQAKPSIYDKVNLDKIPAKMEAEVEVVDAETGKRGKAKVNARETYEKLEKQGDMLQKLLDCLRSG